MFSLRTYILACLTPVAIILAMVLGGMAMANRMVTLQEIETMKRLAAYVALLAVPTMIAGIYGMNFRSMPELSWRYGYESVLLVMAALGRYLFIVSGRRGGYEYLRRTRRAPDTSRSRPDRRGHGPPVPDVRD